MLSNGFNYDNLFLNFSVVLWAFFQRQFGLLVRGVFCLSVHNDELHLHVHPIERESCVVLTDEDRYR